MSSSNEIAKKIIIPYLGLRFQRELANMSTLTTSPFIKTYKLELDWMINQYDSFYPNVTRNTRLCRARPVCEQLGVLDEWEPPFFNVVAATSLGPTLSQLPGEVRNTIYSYLLATGHPQFLRASKALYVEGSGLMAENGVYRVSFGVPKRINYLLPSQRIVDNIRNVDICTDMSHFGGTDWMVYTPPSRWLLEAFGEPGRPRGQCSVTLDVHPSTNRTPLAGFCGYLPLFSDFETVIVRAKVNWLEPDSSTICPKKSLMGKATKTWLKQRETAAVPWSVFMYRFIYDSGGFLGLESYFGEGLLREQDESGFWMVFHPRQAQERLTLAYQAATRGG